MTGRRRMLRAMAVAAGLAILLSGCTDSTNGDSSGGIVSVSVVMTEMAFTPKNFTFHVGDSVTFHFTNEGKVPHEAVIGDQAAQDAAVAAMQAMDQSSTTSLAPTQGRSRPLVRAPGHPGMGLPNVIYLKPAQSGDITFQFAKPTVMLMECHQPGHLEAGMKAKVTIKA